MTAPTLRIQKNRERKARRFVDHFVHQMRAAGVVNPEADKQALEKALAQVREASREQWQQVARAIDDNPPSAETVVLIIAELQRKVEHVEYQQRQANEDAELMKELYRQRGTGGAGAQVAMEEEG
jgi:hypothetical protein